MSTVGWIRCAAVCAWWALVGFETVAQENLLENGGFEDADDGEVSGWVPFVQPADGASSYLDDTVASSGKNSVVLEIATPYSEEPFNNWSQNLLDASAGKELVLKGRIRTEKATAASLWVQCWRREPWSVLKVVSTADAKPVRGTKGWTSVEAKVKVPQSTDYLTVRCVLTGKGKAWFDDVSLERTVQEEKSEVAKDKEATETEKPKPPVAPAKPIVPRPAVPKVEESKPEPEKPRPVVEEAEETEEPSSRPSDASVRELVNANRVLMEGYKALKETNEALADQIKKLQREIAGLRKQLNAKPSAVATAPPEPKPMVETGPAAKPTVAPPPKPEPPAPPLVPSGEDWKAKL